MSMTFREKLAKEYPEWVCDGAFGGMLGCPPGFKLCRIEGVSATDEVCTRCWDHKIPGSDIEDGVTEEMKQQIIEESVVIQKPDGNLEFKVERKTMLGTEDMNIQYETLPVAKILDSGNRRQFESGAVRDIQEGKGRCDLLPLDVVAEVLCTKDRPFDAVLYHIAEFKDTGKIEQLQVAVMEFGVFSTAFKDLPTMILEVSKHFEEGAKKYGENNWQKGIPVRCYIDSAVRHYLKFLRGDKDEPHDRAFCWNILCAIWTCKHKPELNEYAVKEEV